ncbi:MAG: hypothetical protein ABH867_02765 [Patescibacteria group bacterium]|nr:hypothetical protein [Patescibacteria group bacterium]
MFKDILNPVAQENRRRPLSRPIKLTREEAWTATMAPAIISGVERSLALLPKQANDFHQNLGEAPVSTIAYSPRERLRVRTVIILTVPNSRAGVRLDRKKRPVFCPDLEEQAKKEGVVILPAEKSIPAEGKPEKLLQQLASATAAKDPERRRRILDQVKAETKERGKKIAKARIYASTYDALIIAFGTSTFLTLKEGNTFGRVAASVVASVALTVAAICLDEPSWQAVCSPRETKGISQGCKQTLKALKRERVCLSPEKKFFP